MHKYANSQDSALQNYAVIMCRAWERTARYMWNYIQTSSERPLGHVKCAWMRYEFQSGGALGNKPHTHGGLTLYPEPVEVTLSRIRCAMKDFFNVSAGTDIDSLLGSGMVQDVPEFIRLHQLAHQLQTHNCQNAGSRCLKRQASDGSVICRVPKHPLLCSHTSRKRDYATLQPWTD